MPDKDKPKISHIGVPLRRAGEHLDDQVFELILERGVIFGGIMSFTASFALQEWVQAVFHTKPAPVFATVVAVVGCAVGIIGLKSTVARARNLVLGSRGEKVVADALEELRVLGYAVFHDIPGDGFNIDHVLVGPRGVFVIETKARKYSLSGKDPKSTKDEPESSEE
jgi:hypothetical protein